MGVSWGFPEVATLTVHPLRSCKAKRSRSIALAADAFISGKIHNNSGGLLRRPQTFEEISLFDLIINSKVKTKWEI
jgi:hypothetical protein